MLVNRLIRFFIIGVFICFLGCIVYLGFHNVPSVVDDFCFSSTVIDYGFWKAQLMYYQGWSGRYFSAFSPPIYGLGHTDIPPRIMNLIYFIFLVCWLYNLNLVIYYLIQFDFSFKIALPSYFLISFFILALLNNQILKSFSRDIEEDPAHLWNRCLSNYYNKTQIILVKNED